ncbi:hypothetical protein CF15_02025 [Pyrodictium occultum]|uniref:Hydrogenase maturation protease n=1 Tax=Pyrodictium occultum TaxID=2309 RepID=A0A0V8RU81_PYROC|nr:hydrogenase maturation protease [Pyrodictium occultum]KSW11630.1 hypothetical protein CF15_02025 [Pyrodictium occultum]
MLGVGNTLHGDDGIGYCLARGIEACGGVGGARLAAIQHLSPGHISILEGYDTVVFIDSYLSEDMPEDARVAVLEIDPAKLSEAEVAELVQEIDPHSLNPVRLVVLAYAAQLFKGRAYLVGVRPYSIEFMEGLSGEVRKAVPKALAELERLLRRLGARLRAPAGCVMEWIEENCGRPLLD